MKLQIAAIWFMGVLFACESQGNKNVVPVGENSVSTKSIPDADFEEFLNLHAALLRSDRDDQQQTDVTLQNHSNLIESLSTAVNSLLDKIASLQNNLESLQNSTNAEINLLQENVRNLNELVGTLSTRLAETDGKASAALGKYENCVTNIKFRPREAVGIWKEPGYGYTKPYVLTGVDNFNLDQYPDSTFRRSFKIQRAGGWQDAEWE